MEYPKRKHPRLKYYDYSLPGYYYVTIHTIENAPVLSTIECVPAAGAVIRLSEIGQIAESQLFALETRYSYVKIDKYVIMPTHIHVIIRLLEEAAGASPRPTLMDVVAAYKSLTTRIGNQIFHTPGQRLFQASFYETVLRNERAYQECWRYIEENPAKWMLNPENIGNRYIAGGAGPPPYVKQEVTE